MVRWQYRAQNLRGEVIDGRITADSEQLAISFVERLGLRPIEIRHVAKRRGSRFFGRNGDAALQNLLLIKQLSTLARSGVPMLRAIASLADLQTDVARRRAIEEVGQSLRQGQRLSSALEKHMPTLPSYVSYLVAIGEETGDMAAALDGATSQLERDLAVSRDIRSALSYPIFLVTFGLAAIGFMFTVVVPQFAAMLAKSDAKLPTISVVVITVGTAFRAYWIECLGVVALMVVAIVVVRRRPGFNAAVFQLILKLPGLGKAVALSESSRWAAMLATLLRARVTLTQALDVANRTIKSRKLQNSLTTVANNLRQGSRLSDSLEDFTEIDPRVVEMIRIGEQSGGLDAMLTAASELLREEADGSRKRFIALIEPFAVLLIGGCVGTIVVALMLAITSLYDKIL